MEKPPSKQTQEEFMDLLTRHQSQLLGYVFSLLQNLHDAEDVYQRTTMVLWKKFDDYQPDKSFLSWACGIAKFEVMNFLRSKRSQRVKFNLDFLDRCVPSSRSADEMGARSEALRACVDKLPSSDQQLVEQRYGGREKVEYIARQAGRTPQSICNSLRRIRQALLECINRTTTRLEQ